MGFDLSGIANIARNAITPATEVLAANQGAQAQANQQKIAMAIQSYQMQRMAQAQQIENNLKGAQTQAALGTAAWRQHQSAQSAKAQIVRGPNGQLFNVSDPNNPVAIGPTPSPKPIAQGHVVDPVTGKVTFFDPTHPPADLAVNPAPKQDAFTPFQGTDPTTGQPVVRPFNTKTGQFGPQADVNPKTATGIGGGALAQTQQARMLAAVSEARLADGRMRAFEDKLLNGQTNISPLQQAGGSLTTNLTDTHSPLGALLQSGSEFALNKSDPDYAQYLRDAATIGRAEQMISPRGGNETMVRANALLSRAGTGAMKNTIDASRMARQALFGAAGGISQSLTPTQKAKLDQGIERIKSGETGDINLSAPAQPTANKKATGKDYGIFGKPGSGDE